MDSETVDSIISAGADSVVAADRIHEITFKGETVPIAIEQIAQGATKFRVLGEVADFLDRRADEPRNRAGTVVVHSIGSFCDFVNRQKIDAQTVVFADRPRSTLTAILDYHTGSSGPLGWGRERVVFSLGLSPQWKRWIALDGKPQKQDALADFLEDNLDDIGEAEGYPRKLELVEMTRNLHVTIGQKYQRTVQPQTGDVVLVSSTDSGQSTTKIPKEILVQIPVYEGSEVFYRLRFSLRMALLNGEAIFTIRQRNAERALEDAFAQVCKKIVDADLDDHEKDGCPHVEIFEGSAPGPATVG